MAENGGYSYILTFVGPDGKEDTIYSSTSVGGEKETTAGKGLNEATNSLDKFFYLKTLEPGEGGSVKLLVGLDGESQGNIYQDTLAKLMMNFAVEDNSDPTLSNPPTFTTTTSKVKTGDIWSIASAVVFVIERGLSKMKRLLKYFLAALVVITGVFSQTADAKAFSYIHCFLFSRRSGKHKRWCAGTKGIRQ